MKTVCPHCGQNYDIEENLLNMELICSVCEKRFISTPAEVCPPCSNENPPAPPAGDSPAAGQNAPPFGSENPIWQRIAPVIKSRAPWLYSFILILLPILRKIKKTGSSCSEKISDIFWIRNVKLINVECQHCGQHYNMPESSTGSKIICTNCNKEFKVLKGIHCPHCKAWNSLGSTNCSSCKMAFEEFEDKSLIKKVLFWPAALITLLWAFTGHILTMYFCFNISSRRNEMIVGMFGLLFYHLTVFGLICCCRKLSFKFLKLLWWPLFVNFILASTGSILAFLLSCDWRWWGLLLLPMILHLLFFSIQCNMCNSNIFLGRILHYALAIMILFLIVAFLFKTIIYI